MKFENGINTDVNPNDQPAGTLRGAQNMIFGKQSHAYMNEQGTEPMSLSLSGTDKIVGSIPVGSDKVVHFVKGTKSMIYVFNEPNSYIKLIEASSLGFSTSAPIKGVAVKNQKGEDIVIWVQKGQPMRMLNITTPGVSNTSIEENPNLLNLLPNARIPVLDSVTVKEDGGALKSGSYYFSIAYEAADGSTTDYLSIYNPIAISKGSSISGGDEYFGSASDLTTTKAIQLHFSHLDPQYDKVHLAVIKVINGQFSAAKIGEFDIPALAESLSIIYSSHTWEEDLLLEEVMINSANYTSAEAVAYQDRKLYLGKMEKEPIPDLQLYVNNIKVKWTYANNVSINGVQGSFRDGGVSVYSKGFMPGEVYALYAAFLLDDGTYTPAFHIPGRAAAAGEKDTVTATEDLLVATGAKKYQLQDTSGSDGTMGYWENEDEYYENDFPWYSHQNVRHHRFPTVQKLLSYGKDVVTNTSSTLNKLYGYLVCEVANDGNSFSEVSSDQMPSGDTSIAYDSSANRIVINESGYLSLGLSLEVTGSLVDTVTLTIYKRKYIPVAPGVFAVLPGSESILYTDSVSYDPSVYAGYGAPSPTQIGFTVNKTIDEIAIQAGEVIEIRCTGANIACTGSVKFIYTNTPIDITSQGTKFGYMLGVQLTDVQIPEEYLDRIQGIELFYAKRDNSNSLVLGQTFLLTEETDEAATASITSGVIDLTEDMRLVCPDIMSNEEPASVKMDYLHAEAAVVSGAYATPTVGNIAISTHSYEPQTVDDYRETALVATRNGAWGTSYDCGETTASAILVSLRAHRTNIYHNFRAQPLISTGWYFPLNKALSASQYYSAYKYTFPKQLGGDVFIGDFKFLTSFFADTGTKDVDTYSPTIYSKRNIQLRLKQAEDFGLTYAYAPLISDYATADTDRTYKRDNYIFFNPDQMVLNELNDVFSQIENKGIEKFPYRIIESDINQKEGTKIGIRKFRVSNYYEMPRNRGAITNLEAAGSVLLIHTEESLYRTRPQTELQADGSTVVVGDGTIFALPPEEILNVPTGYAGCRNPYSAFYSKAGYFFIDRKHGKLFLLNEKLEEISNKGMRNYFRDNTDFIMQEQLKGTGNNQLTLGDQIHDLLPFGYTASFDEENYRIVVTKLAYKFTEAGKALIGDPEETIIADKYYTIDGKLYRFNGGESHILSNYTEVVPGISDFGTHFEEDSWTWSYSIIQNAWCSKHTYRPNTLFKTKKYMYGVEDSKIYRHNTGNFSGVFYLKSLDQTNLTYIELRAEMAYIDPVFKSAEGEFMLSNINWLSELIASEKLEHQKTFNKVMVYNSWQCSDYITVVPGVNTHKSRGKWNFNAFWDIVLDHEEPFLKNDEPIATNLDNNQVWYKLKRFIDNYAVVRLGYTNHSPALVYLYELDISARKAYR